MASRLYDLITAERAGIIGTFVERIVGHQGAAAPDGTRRSEIVDHLPQFLASAPGTGSTFWFTLPLALAEV